MLLLLLLLLLLLDKLEHSIIGNIVPLILYVIIKTICNNHITIKNMMLLELYHN